MKNLKPTLLFKSIAHLCMFTFCLLFLSVNTMAQETLCGDGLDNDGDGLYDCADTDCAVVSPTCDNTFQCVEGLYQRIVNDFSILDVTTGDYVPLFNDANLASLQGGYNVRDGYMYGMKSSNSGGDTWLRKVSKTSISNVCTVTGTPAGFQGTSADMDFDNYLYLIQTKASPDFMSRVNVTDCTRLSKTFANAATPTTVAALPTTVADIAYIHNESTATKKVFYGVSKAPVKLYRFIFDDALDKATWEVIADYSAVGAPVTTDGFGAIWYDNDANQLLASQNNQGNIYRIDLASPSTIPLAFSGAVTTNNDGFNCSLAPAPAALLPLPVELISFTTDVTDCMADLKWLTASEENTAHFEVQQSTDGKQWTTIEKLAAGVNSQTEINYNFATQLQAQQTTYFRLKMVDLDGSFAYSPVRTTICEKENHRTFIAYPNPVNNLLHIDGLTAGTRIKLVRVDGVICKNIAANAQEMELDLSDLSSGFYVLQIQDENGRSSFQKITKR